MKKLYLIVMLLLISGCNLIPKKVTNKPIDTPQEKTVSPTKEVPTPQASMLDYISSFSKLSANQQKLEFNEVLSASQKDKNNVVLQMKLAIMYALPNSRIQDSNKALSMINELQKTNWMRPENEQIINLMREIAVASQRDNQKSKEDQKRIDSMQQKNEQLLQQNIQLEQKLEALKRIEKTMVDRDQGVKK